ncbi:WD40 repeat domain-containing serine/threonine-protein kinase [Zavarzinella formosa]|uniref:WD40 repeat domain-containing serine/threonine-protein kinase n=1 Tax=Zavarzinella formosa TaxID=360055 RepID=UPI000316DF00|nr:WD40 repeat domain-containing serine/threonine protein kinase [Zavarzinella formosa]
MNSISTRALDIFGEWASAKVRGQSLDFTSIVGDDSALRSEVERLIADSAPEHELPPDTPRYMFRTFIAGGGMGEVWRAFDLDLRREVAIKLLKGNLGESVSRFLAEAQLVAKLEHPAIVPVYDAGLLKDGRPFFVMKLIQGKRKPDGSTGPPPTLEQVLKSRESVTQDLPRLTDVFQQICGAVAYAHAMKPPVMHRDLKPSNVMVGLFGEVLVTDWGLAKAIFEKTPTNKSLADTVICLNVTGNGTDTEVAGESKANAKKENEHFSVGTAEFLSGGVGYEKNRPERAETKYGLVKGTPAYMAPEQARGENDLVGPASDVFALGGILCCMLTGKPVFLGDDMTPFWKAGEGDLTETFARLEDSRADPELIAIACRCLSPEISGRPADAGELAILISDYRAGVAQRLRRIELDQAAREAKAAELRKRRLMQMILGGLLLSAALFMIVGWFLAQARLDEETEKSRITDLRLEVSEHNRRDHEELAHLMRGMELVSSHRGNWTENSRWEFGQAKNIASAPHLIPQIRSALMDGFNGASLETPVRLEPQAKVSVIAYSSDGRWLALADRFTIALSGGLAVHLYDTTSGKKIRTVVFPKSNPITDFFRLKFDLVTKPDGITSLALSRDNQLLVAGTRHGSVHIADLTTESATIRAGSWLPSDSVVQLEFSKDQKTILAMVGNRNGRIVYIDPLTGELIQESKQGSSFGFVTVPLTGHLWTFSGPNLVRLDPVTFRETERRPVGGSSAIALSPAGDMLAFAIGKRLFLTEVQNPGLEREFREGPQSPAHLEDITGLAFDPRGRFLVSTSEWSNDVKFWDITTGSKLLQSNAGRGLSKCAIHPDGTEITVGSENGALRYRVCRTIAERRRLTGSGMVLNFDLADDGNQLVTAIFRPNEEVRFEEWEADSQIPRPLFGPKGLKLAEEDSVDLQRTRTRQTGYASNKGYGWFDGNPPQPAFHQMFDGQSFMRFGPSGEMWLAGNEFLKLKRPGYAELSYKFRFDQLTGMSSVTGLGIGNKHLLVGMRSGYASVFPATILAGTDKIPSPTSLSVEHLTSLRVLEPFDDKTWLVGTRSGKMHRFELNAQENKAVNQRTWTAHDDEVTTLAVISPEYVVTGGRDRTLALWRLTASAEDLVCRWETSGPVRQLRYDGSKRRLLWLNVGEHGLRELDLSALWKMFADHTVGPPKPSTWP